MKLFHNGNYRPIFIVYHRAGSANKLPALRRSQGPSPAERSGRSDDGGGMQNVCRPGRSLSTNPKSTSSNLVTPEGRANRYGLPTAFFRPQRKSLFHFLKRQFRKFRFWFIQPDPIAIIVRGRDAQNPGLRAANQRAIDHKLKSQTPVIHARKAPAAGISSVNKIPGSRHSLSGTDLMT